MLRWRLILGVVIIGALVGLVYLDIHAQPTGVFLMPLAVVMAILASREIVDLLAARGVRPHAKVVYIGNALMVAANMLTWDFRQLIDPRWIELWTPAWADFWNPPWVRLGPSMIVFALAGLAAILVEMRHFEKPGEAMARLGATIFSLYYVGVLLTFLCQLRLLGRHPNRGIVALVTVIAVVKLSDIGAYAVGSLCGKHKMSPIISPGKTWQGFVGGLAGAVLGAWLGLNVLAPALDVKWMGESLRFVPLGLVLGIVGILGDLAESMIKRDCGKKDSSSWLPGFGGVLDLLDSLLFAAPVAWLVFAIAILGRHGL